MFSVTFVSLGNLPSELGAEMGRLEREDVVDPSIARLVDLIGRLSEEPALAHSFVRDADAEPSPLEPAGDGARTLSRQREVVIGGAHRVGVTDHEERDLAEVSMGGDGLLDLLGTRLE